MSGPSAPPPADLTQPSRTSSIHLPPPSRASIRCFDEDTDDGIESYLADDIGLPNGDVPNGEIGLRADGLVLRATDLGLHADGLVLPTDLGLHADGLALPTDGDLPTDLGLHADGLALPTDGDLALPASGDLALPTSGDLALPASSHLGLPADDLRLPTDALAEEVDSEDPLSEESLSEEDYHTYLSDLEVSEDDVIPPEEQLAPQDDVVPEEEEKIAPEDEEISRLPHVSFEDSFLGDEDEVLSSKVSFQFSAEEDVIAMGIPVGGKSNFLRETNRFQVNLEANQGALEAEANQGGLEAEANQGGLEAEANQGGLEAEANQGGLEAEANQGGLEADADQGADSDADQGADSDADQWADSDADQWADSDADQGADSEKKGYGSRKGGGYEIGSESLSFKFGRFRSNKKYKYRAGGRCKRSRCPDQEGKELMRAARAQLAEALHLEAEDTRLEILDQGVVF